MDLLQSNTVKFQQHLWKLQTNWWGEFNRGTIVKAITWVFRCSNHWSKQDRSSIQQVTRAIQFHNFPRHVTCTKLFAKTRCCALPVKISPPRGMESTAAGSLGDDGHHVVRTQNLNPVAVGVLNEGQATNFTCGRKTQGQKLTRFYSNIVCNTLSNH